MKRSGTLGQTSANRLESAAKWLVKLDAVEDAQLTPSELQAWEDWAADEANRGAFNELAVLLQQVKAVSAASRPTRAELAADQASDRNTAAESLYPPLSFSTARISGGGTATLRRWGLSIAASVLLMIASLVPLRLRTFLPSPTPELAAVTYGTTTGEQRRVLLPDGSTITMGGASLLSVVYTVQQRNVTLVRGEALFHVAHSTARPFRVHVGSGVITAVGTRFNVLRTTQGVTVTVTEGTVVVAPAPVMQRVREPGTSPLSPPRWLPERVTYGEEMSYQVEGEASPVKRADPKLAIAWSHGTLVYDRRPLSEVIEDVTRYWGQQMVLGPGVGDLLYSGTVGERDIGAWIRGLPNIFPVEVTEAEHGKLQIQLRQH